MFGLSLKKHFVEERRRPVLEKKMYFDDQKIMLSELREKVRGRNAYTAQGKEHQSVQIPAKGESWE